MKAKGYIYGIALSVLILVLMAANLWFGSINIPAGAVWNTLTGNEVEKASWTFIIWESRLPQAVTALLCGAALAASGLMLQTAFNNPLAGPSILGINSGASLGVALVMLAGGGSIATGVFTLSGFFSVILGAFVGSMVVMGLILFFSTLIKSNIMLLITGIMIGYITSSAISLLNSMGPFFYRDKPDMAITTKRTSTCKVTTSRITETTSPSLPTPVISI